MFASVVIGSGKAVHTLTEAGVTACKREAGNAETVEREVTCKSCLKAAVVAASELETLFSLSAPEVAPVTEAPEESVSEAPEVHTETVDELETVELEAETGPTDADMRRIMASAEIAETVLTGYTANEWIDVMLSTDTHSVDMSRGLAVERLYMTKQAARKAKREAAELARVERDGKRREAAERAETARNSDAYAAMTWAMGALRSRGVVMTLAEDVVRVESLTWVKGEGDTLETVATFTVREDGKLTIHETGGKTHTVTITRAIAIFTEILPERSRDLMPRKYRDMLRVHANRTVSDITGNRAARAVDGVESAVLTSEDLTEYAATLEARADGLKVKTSGKRSMQGVKLTEAEKRESDRARQAAYRAAKRARALAADMESLKSA